MDFPMKLPFFSPQTLPKKRQRAPGATPLPQSKSAAARTPQAPAAPCTAKASMGSSTCRWVHGGFFRIDIRKSWENHQKIMGKSSENHGKIIRKSLENHGKIIRNMMMYDDLLMGFHWILMGCYWDFMGK